MPGLKPPAEIRFCEPAEAAHLEADVAIVVDVLHTAALAPWLFRRGVRSVQLVDSAAVAAALGDALGDDAVVLTDDASTLQADLAASPGTVAATQPGRQPRLRGQHAVVCSGGARPLLALMHVPLVLSAGLVNAQATAGLFKRVKRDEPLRVLLVPAGGGAADQDVAGAELIGAWLQGRPRPEGEAVRRALDSTAARGLRAAIDAGDPRVHPDDLALATEVDRFRRAMVAYAAPYVPVVDLRPSFNRSTLV